MIRSVSLQIIRRHPARSHKVGFGHRVAAGKKRDVMASPDQFFGQIGEEAFSASVTLWRHTFIERGDLRDSHVIKRFVCSGIGRSTGGESVKILSNT